MNEKKKIKVKVLRPFFKNGKIVKKGEVLDLDFHLAHELKEAQKVEFVKSENKKK